MRRIWGSTLAFVLLLAGCGDNEPAPPPAPPAPPPPKAVHVGAKDFPEQQILAHIITALIDATPGYDATVVGPFPNTKAIHEAMVDGKVDAYVEYSGTADEAILGLTPLPDPDRDADRLRKFYEEKFQADWLLPLGFDNTFVFAVAADGPQGTLTDFGGLARQAITLTAGMGAEFATRPDGYPLLQDKYGMVFHDVKPLTNAEAYAALDAGEVSAIVANSTDGELTQAQYHMLPDNLNILPRYAAVPILRYGTEAKDPALRTLLMNLGGKISTDTMRKLNADVAVHGKSPEEVAQAFVTANRDYLLAPTKLEAPTPAVNLAPAKDFPAESSKVEGAAPPIAPAENP